MKKRRKKINSSVEGEGVRGRIQLQQTSTNDNSSMSHSRSNGVIPSAFHQRHLPTQLRTRQIRHRPIKPLLIMDTFFSWFSFSFSLLFSAFLYYYDYSIPLKWPNQNGHQIKSGWMDGWMENSKSASKLRVLPSATAREATARITATRTATSSSSRVLFPTHSHSISFCF